MRLDDLQEARYVGGHIDAIKVHQVYQLYKEHDNFQDQAIRNRHPDYVSAFSEMQVDVSARQRLDSEGEVFTQLVFRSHNRTSQRDDLRRWVLDYAKRNNLPYTDVTERGTSSIALQYRIPHRRKP